ncbi:hypothetical protein EDB80DRAFT_875319 [Ilyonectria destructans]|nr:hypothetical protein EDB80DRAFT_875319 [Ilyonectria destructans]
MTDIVEGVPTAPTVPSSSAAPPTSTPGGPSNKFQHAIAAWRNLDFTTLASNLDNTASEILALPKLYRPHHESFQVGKLGVSFRLHLAVRCPDPYPLLEASVDSMLVSEETLPKVTKENEHLQGNVAKPTTQLEETETRLQTESTAREELEDNRDTWVKEVESSWSAARRAF